MRHLTSRSASIVHIVEGTMGKSIEEAGSRSLNVAEASERTNLSAQTVAAAVEELSSSITEISRQVSHSSSIASSAVADANEANDHVQGRLADGDLEAEIPAQGQRNEIGKMADAVQIFKNSAIRVKQMESEQAEAKLQAEREKKAMMHKMADDLEGQVKSVIISVKVSPTFV